MLVHETKYYVQEYLCGLKIVSKRYEQISTRFFFFFNEVCGTQLMLGKVSYLPLCVGMLDFVIRQTFGGIHG